MLEFESVKPCLGSYNPLTTYSQPTLDHIYSTRRASIPAIT